MKVDELTKLIIDLIGTAIPGYLAYYCLVKLNIIHPNINKSDENKAILNVLSLINCFIGLLFLEHNKTSSLWGNIFIVFVILFLVSTVILPFIIRWPLTWFNSYLNFIRNRNEIGAIDNTPIYKAVFHHGNRTRLAIFTFSGECIAVGQAESVPEDNQSEYFAISFTSNIDVPDWEEEEILKQYKEAEKKQIGKFLTYIDFEKSLKFYVFIENTN